MRTKKRIAILLGDPTGVGPELIVNVLEKNKSPEAVSYIIVGDKRIYHNACSIVQKDLPLQYIQSFDEEITDARIGFYDYQTMGTDDYTVGKMNIKGGMSVLKTLAFALEAAKTKSIDGILFAPFNKQAMHAAGLRYGSELEYFKDFFHCPKVPGEVNILEQLWVVRVTSHVPIKDISSLLSTEKIVYAIEFLHAQLQQLGSANVPIFVTGLNPHNGENGLFGTEEDEIIIPAVQMAQKKQIRVEGPFPADTIFNRLDIRQRHGMVCMYHDQAQIGLKTLGANQGVSLHAGLPIPICTPAHGTAFDLAGKNIASTDSCRNALRLLTTLVQN